MNSALLSVYRTLPSSCRSLAASVHGFHLRFQRYGSETDEIVQGARTREKWSCKQWEQWQQEQLVGLLHRAVTKVPFYRRYWARRARSGEKACYEDLTQWPILSKESVRANPQDFVADDCSPDRLYEDHTSGTTGTPLKIWLSRQAVRHWYGLFEARTRGWLGVTRHDRWGLVGGQPVVAPGQVHPPFWVWNAPMHQLYLSAMHISERSAKSYLEAIARYRLKYLIGYPSSLTYLAQEACACDQKVALQGIITNAEPLYAWQRRILEAAFSCPVQETYGLAEIVCMASQCQEGRLHLWPDVGVVEILDENHVASSPGTPGRVVATGLINSDMPLIRYDTGDRAALSAQLPDCRCGRSMPYLTKVWGRWDDVIITSDGRRPVLLDRIFDPPLRVKEGQIIQNAIGQFTVRVVPADGWSEEHALWLEKGLLDLVGKAQVKIELVAQLPRTWAGKARILISEIPFAVASAQNGVHERDAVSPHD